MTPLGWLGRKTSTQQHFRSVNWEISNFTFLSCKKWECWGYFSHFRCIKLTFLRHILKHALHCSEPFTSFPYSIFELTLVLLNKLRCHTLFKFSANQITWSRLLIWIHILNGKQCRSRSVSFFRSQLIWIYTVCKGRIYPGSAGQGLTGDRRLNCILFSYNGLLLNTFLTYIPTVWPNSAEHKLIFSLFFPENKLWQEETICMKYQSLFSGKNKKNISKCCLLKILSSMLGIEWIFLNLLACDATYVF